LIFPDGSRLDYLIRDDRLRYVTPAKEVVDIPLIYDATQKKSRINPSIVWQWRGSGRVLTEQEKSELLVKLETFMKRRPKEFTV
jgi:hypothetical protein